MDSHSDFLFEFENYIPREKGEVNLMTTDYTLNSPIICDDLEAWYGYLKSGHLPRRSEHFRSDLQEWTLYDETRKNVRSVDDIIKLGGITFLKGGYNSEPLENFQEVLNLSKDVKGILKTYWEKTGKMSVDFTIDELLMKLNSRFKNYLGGFFCLHKLILYFNARQNHRKWFHENDKDFSTRNGQMVGMSTYGRWTLFGKIIYFIDLDVCVNKEIVLSWKDTLIARFCTGLSSIERNDKRYGHQYAKKILSIYDLGDEILSENGNIGFSSIKLLEPLCNQRMVELAGEVRPQIPKFDILRDHLNSWFAKKLPGSIQMSKIRSIISNLTIPHEVMGIYGLYRHWDHPNIDYLLGLSNMKERKTRETDHLIDLSYVNCLASDLARHILTKKYREKKKWFVDINLMKKGHPLYNFIKDNTWPDTYYIEQMGDTWNLLPLTACFDLPDSLDPSIIYADKSHSLNRSKIIEHIQSNPYKPIPSKKVLNSVLENPATDIKKFLSDIDENGLDQEDLAIGLKAKERDMS